MKVKDNCLLDTSALFAYTDNEEGSDLIADIFVATNDEKLLVFVSAMTIMEMYYVTRQELGEEAAKEIVLMTRLLPVKELNLSAELILPAGDFKARYGISVTDAWIAATAKVHNLMLIHKDPEFEPLKEELNVTELPYKSARPRSLK